MGGIISKPKAPKPAPAPEPEPVVATDTQKREAARRRSRSSGIRSLLNAGRLGGGNEEEQTTLGVG